LVVLGSLAASTAPAQPVDSSIERVTIYPNQLARVARVAELRPGSASGILAFEDLPASIVDDSVRLAVESGTGELGAVETARAPVGEPPRERERTLRKRLRKLRHQHEAARDRAEAARTEITFIDGLAKLPEGKNAAQALAGPDAAERWQGLWERIGTGARTARERLRSACAAPSARPSASTTRSTPCKSASINWASRGPSASRSAPATAMPTRRCACA